MVLDELRERAASCELCSLHKGRINPVFDKGSPQSKLMICGMVPAYEENKQGIPFVGKAGKLLDRILEHTKIKEVYITNLVKCFLAPGKRLEEEWINSCVPYIVSQIGLIHPYVIITLGADATNTLLGLPLDTPIGRNRGYIHDYGISIKVIPTYHPSYLLRKGGEYSDDFGKVVNDFILARDTMSDLRS